MDFALNLFGFLILPFLYSSARTDLDFLGSWSKTTELPKGCYEVGNVVKCYRLSRDWTMSYSYAAEECRYQLGRLAIPENAKLMGKIYDDVVKESKMYEDQKVWLGPKVRAHEIKLVDDEGLEVKVGDTDMWNSTIYPAADDRCMVTVTLLEGVLWDWYYLEKCVAGDYYYYLCEYPVTSCPVDSLVNRVPYAKFWPYLAPGTRVPNNITISVECWKGYRPQSVTTTTCKNREWSNFPQCI